MSEQPTGNLTQDVKDLYVKVRNLTKLLRKSVPAGLIAIWSGYVTDIPAGWVLCDGNNDTPDLRGKFVYGATDDTDNDDTGGEATHTLTTDEIPAHTHTYLAVSGSGSEEVAGGTSYNRSTVTGGSTGGGGAHENLPPYLKKAYIMFRGVDELLKDK